MSSYYPFNDRFYRVTENSVDTSHTFVPFTLDFAKPAPPAAEDTAQAKHHCLNPTVDTETAGAHFTLTIKWHDDRHPTKCGYHVEKNQITVFAETTYGEYKRLVSLPTDLDADKAKISYAEGLFKAHFPRTNMAWVTWLL
ncbi:hypothetical protein H4R33_004803 [Dimargaris cristalligena]|uniref:Uncharacterized protein n=1 Tax=Dimargaris cristalligena TaxID=215637 RepID=A0A4P9ZX60_9FUNG|nr:hypothetical protein H4R33_004803 [Dimargaris cristalligena]RKP37290.1 hypothetical protein BJ085DRAFT_33250 [Dimargaris cristalligena]|eukprot:RKP37290.1 hypothetical protein BJ085DRAFT_33250 [Dimargaris cristalligena]